MAQPATFYVRVSATVVDALGLLLTAWRIYFRLRIDRFWWEDAWAVALFTTGLAWIIAYWIYVFSNGLTSIVLSWFYSLGFTSIVTMARMSVLFSIIRIVHRSSRLLKLTYACVAFFVASWVIIIVEKVWQCASDPGWHRATPTASSSFCVVEPQISIFKFTTDCIAVSILVVLPLRMLWRVKLPGRQKRMILSIFSSSVVLAFGALFHTVGQILNILIIMTVGLHVEVALSIVVCNLLVVVTYLYRRRATGTTELEDSSTDDDDDFTTRQRPPAPATTLCLTSVDLEMSFSRQQSSAVMESV